MTMKSEEKFKEKNKLWFQIWHEEFGEFSPNTQKSKNFTSMDYFCPKYMRFELKKYRGVIFHHTEQ